MDGEREMERERERKYGTHEHTPNEGDGSHRTDSCNIGEAPFLTSYPDTHTHTHAPPPFLVYTPSYWKHPPAYRV